MKDESLVDGSDSLYRVLTLMANSDSLYRVLTLKVKHTWRLSWKMRVLIMALTAYIGFSPWQLTHTCCIEFSSSVSLHGDFSEIWKSSWWFQQSISGSHPDG